MATEKVGEIYKHTPESHSGIAGAIGAVIGGGLALLFLIGIIGAIFG